MNTFRSFLGLTRFRSLTTVTHKLTQVSCKQLLRFNSNSFCVTKLDFQVVRSMSQKSITSFFKITPKKADDPKNTSLQITSPSTIENDADITPKVNGKSKSKTKRKRSASSESSTSNPEKSPQLNGKSDSATISKTKSKSDSSPVPNGKAKATAKRQRTISSDDDSPKASKRKSSPVSSEKKKQSKRLRIESSGSEAETETKPVINAETETKPVVKAETETKPKIKKEKLDSPKQQVVKPKKAVQKTTPTKKEKEDNVKVELPSEQTYNPFKSKYDPVSDACWSKGEEVPYLALAKTLEAIEAISARLKIVEILSNYFRSVLVLTPDDLLPSVYMCLNQLAPAYYSLELGIAETYLMKAIGQSTGRTLAQVKSAAQKSGDLGLVAEQARSTQRTMFQPPPLKVRKVFQVLKEIANMTGQASVNKKISKIQQLYIACRHSEARYLIRSLEGKLRIGLAEQSVLQALALSTVMTPPGPDGLDILDASKGLSAEQFKEKLDKQALLIKTTYCECPNYDLIIPALLKYGVAKLPEHCRLTPGIPLKPMLAHPTKGLHEVFNRFENQEFTCEYKYDGERAQIHVPGDTKADIDKASIFSRNQENNTTKYPDVLSRLQKLLKEDVTSCVLDTEAVAYDVEKKQILPFQILSTRKRKDANQSEIKVQVCVFVFDLLYLNGRPLVKEPLATRRDLLKKHFNEVEGEWHFATSKDCTSMEEVQQFLDESIKGSCEGLMVKMLKGDNAKYDIARRSHNWLKLKKDYLDGIGDTIDAVVIGAYAGKGKRAGVYGGFLLACLDSTSDEYQALCKLGTGFSDDDLKTLTEQLKEHVVDVPKSYYRYDSSHSPDTWFSPACVWEVRCADLSLSPAHRAAIGLVDPDKGISLRFPRFIRVRDDKSPEQATTAQQIAEMYLSQDQVKNTGSKVTNFDDFY